MESLGDLISVCRAADTEKVTERKKQIDKLKLLLSKSYITSALDKCSESKQRDKKSNKGFGWDSLFKVAKNLIWREAEALQKVKDIQTTANVKKKQEICSLLKQIVKLANKSGQFLAGSDVVNHVINIVKDEFTRPIFGSDHTSILLKDILSVRKYWSHLEAKTWNELLCLYCRMLEESPANIDRVMIARTIHVALGGASQQCDLRAKKILPVFEEYFRKVKQERSINVLEYTVCAMNTLCHSMATEGRTQICRLGETIFVPLLYCWNNRPSDRLKTQLIEFYQLQMIAHHPRGAQDVEKGALAVDTELWKSNLRKLYEVIYNDLQALKTRTKFTSSARESDQGILKDNYLHLAADLCHQLFTERSSIIEVTQASFLETQPGGATKKRRVESGWGVLREVISQHSATQAAIPWIQLLTVLIERYPKSIPEEEFQPILCMLQLAYAESKKPLVTKWLLRCLVAMVTAQDAMGMELSTFTLEMCQSLWQKIWVTSLRFISLHHAQDDAFCLLSALLRSHLVSPDKDMWSLFLPTLHQPTDPAVHFLATFLREYDLPERFTPRSLLISADNHGQCSHPLRRQLLEWLLPSQDSDLDEGQVKITQDRVKANVLAEVLVTLTLRDTHSIKISPELECHDICDRRNLRDIEQVYLMTSFDDKTRVTVDKESRNAATELSLIVSLNELVMEKLIRDTRHLLEITDPEVPGLELMLHYIGILSSFLTSLVSRDIMSLKDAAKGKLSAKLKALLNKFATHYSEMMRKDVKISPLLNDLKALFSSYQIIHQGAAEHGQQMAALLRSLIPSELVYILLDIALDKIKKKKSTSFTSTDLNSRSMSRKVSSASALDDFDFDNDFDLGNSDQTVMNEDLELESQDSGSQGSSHDSPVGSESLFSKSLLTEHDQQRLLVVDILASYCTCDGATCGNNNNEVGFSPEISSQTVSQKLMRLVDPEEDYWGESRPICLQMLQHLVDGLSSASRVVTDDEMEIFQDAIRSVCKKHRRDQDVCRVVLQLVSRLVRQLQDDREMVSMAKRQARDVALQLVQVFWTQMLNNVYDHHTRLAVADCVNTFIQCDPEARWTVWKARNDEDDDLYLRDAYPQLLEDRRHKIRLHITRNIQCLFTRPSPSGPLPLSRLDQDAMFDQIYTILQNTATVQGRNTPDEQTDEVINRTSSLLHTLANMARISTACEKKSLFAICQMTKERNLDIGLVQKVLRQVAVHHGYESLTPYMSSHMPYILHHWLQNSYQLSEFPYRLSGIGTQADFYKAEKSTIIPLLIMTKNTDALKSLARPLSTDWCHLVRECIPETLIHILPLFAATKAEETAAERDVQKRLAHANSCYEFLTQIVKNEVIEQSIVDNLEDIVVKILMSLSDSSENSGESHLIGQGSEANPPCYNTVTITATLDYLTKGHTAKAKTLISLLAKSQDQIQKVMLSLTVHLSRTHRLPEKYRVLLMYRLFVKLLLREFHQQLGGSWAFVLRQVIYTLVHIIQQADLKRLFPGSYESAVIQLALGLLHNLVQVATESCAPELGRFLPIIISSLVPLAQHHGDVQQQSEQVIRFLVVDSYRELKEAIRLLDPLPDSPSFNAAKQIQRKLKYEKGIFSLREEIEHFLLAEEQHSSGSTLCRQQETLHLLYDKLNSQKKQLAQLAKDYENESEENILVRLVYCLIKLAKSTNQNEAEAAGKCLGEIGPLNLPVIAVKETLQNKYLEKALVLYSDSKSKQYCWIFHKLNDYLIDSNIDTVIAAGSVLKQVLATKTGISFYTDYKSTVRDHLFQYLHPFKATKKRVAAQAMPFPSDTEFCQVLDVDTLWLPLHTSHEQWICRLVTTMIDCRAVTDEILQLLSPVCKVKSGFCEVVFPFIVHDVLTRGSDTCYKVFSKHFNKFFQQHCQHHNNKNGSSRGDISRSSTSVKTMLSVVLYLRQQQRILQGRQQLTVWDNNFWLDLDYLPIAQAAHNCASHFTALLLSEIWCDVQREKLRQSGTQSASESQGTCTTFDSTIHGLTQSSQLETLSNLANPADINVQSLLLEAYRCVGDPDALYGCGVGRLADTMSRIKTYEHEDSWYKALGSYDVQMSKQDDDVTQLGLLQALQNCGCSHVLDMYLRGLSHTSLGDAVCIQDLQYEAAWRSTNWTLDTPSRLDSKCSFNQALYTSFTALHDQDLSMAAKALHVARQQSVRTVSLSSLECVRNVYPTLCQLHTVTQAEDVLRMANSSDKLVDTLMDKWASQDELLQNDFIFTEPVLSQRCALLDTVPTRSHQTVVDAQLTLLVRLAKCAREAGRNQSAERAIHRLRCLDTPDETLLVWSWRVEEAWVFWSRGETDTAKHLMKQLIRKLEQLQEDDMQAAMLYPKCLGIYGNWLAETKSENPNVIMEQYLRKATDLLEVFGAEDEAALDAYLSLARFADTQYQNIVNHMNSATFEAKQALVMKAKVDAEQLRQIGEKNRLAWNYTWL